MRFIPFSGEERVCGPSQAMINGKLRSSDDTCSLYCSLRDFRDWRTAARDEVQMVLKQRPDLPQMVRDGLVSMNAEIDAMPETIDFELGHRTDRLARIHQYANCVATWDPKTSDPPGQPKIPDKPKDPMDSMTSLMLAAGALLAALAVYKIAK